MAILTLGITPFATEACESLPRTTLALYDSSRELVPRDTRIHRFAEIILNHLGQRLIYHDVAMAGIPAVEPGSIAMVLSWLDEPATCVASVWDWIAEEEFCAGFPRIVAVGTTGLGQGESAETSSLIGTAMGIQEDGETYAIGSQAALSHIDDKLMNYEADFVLESEDYRGIHARRDGQTLLRVRNERVEVDLAVLGPAGGYLHSSAAVDVDDRGGAFWIVDPFAFFGHVLEMGQWPVPDPTTHAGRRVFFSVVGGEGWLDVMPARVFGEVEQLASEVLVAKLIEPFADLPITVAVSTGDLETGLGGEAAERGRLAAVSALSQSNVASGAQGHSDIRNWGFFARYDPSREAEILDRSADEGVNAGLMATAVQTLGDAFANTGASTFLRTPGAPRKYALTPFDLDREVAGSLEEIKNLDVNERPPRVFVWSGDARPFEAALVAVNEAGVENIGGGGGLYYAGYRSLTGLWPFAVPVGKHLQIYDALSGDAEYTGFWTASLYGFYGFGETLQRTEEPRRLKPYQLSFSARSARFFETRRAIERYLEEARTADVIPVHAAKYAKMVRGFHSMRILPQAPGVWRIVDRGDLQTVRFDAAAERVLDMRQSTGVLGARRKGESLYVSLDPGAETPLVALVEGRDEAGMVLGTAAPALVSSRVDIKAWHRTECSVEVEATGVTGGPLELVGVPEDSYRVTVTGGLATLEETVVADANGRLAIFVPVGAEGVGGASISGSCAKEPG